MQTSTVQPVTNLTTVSQNITTTTKSREQILTQSSGAMIALIVIGIIIILTIVLLILKTYNRRTHTSRMLGGRSRPRKKMSSSTTNTNMAMSNLGANSISGSVLQSPVPLENGFRLPRVEHPPTELQSTASGSTVVTIHDAATMENT